MKNNLNLNDNWEPNEKAYLDMAAKKQELEYEASGIESIVSNLQEDISMWEGQKKELLEQAANLNVEDFI